MILYNMDREFARLTRIDFVYFFIFFLIEFHDFFYLLSIMLFIFHDSDHEFDKLTQFIFLNPFSIDFFFQSHSPTTPYPFNFFLIIIIS